MLIRNERERLRLTWFGAGAAVMTAAVGLAALFVRLVWHLG
jgi:hypothetical protein